MFFHNFHYYINVKKYTVKIKDVLKTMIFWCGIPWLQFVCHFTTVDISCLGADGFGFQVAVIKGHDLRPNVSLVLLRCSESIVSFKLMCQIIATDSRSFCMVL